MSILLAIKPEYADAIYRGDKLYECRKHFPPKSPTQLVFMYETCPVHLITGCFGLLGSSLLEVISAWRNLAPKLCADEKSFFDYYKGCEEAHLWKIGFARRFETPVPLPDIGLTAAPRSYRFLSSTQAWYLQQFM